MKSTYFAASMLIVGLSLAATGYSQSFLTNGLAAYYPFNGNANDASGNGMDGVVVGATLTADRFGQTNSAYRFNGTSWIQLPDAVLPAAAAELTISAWALADNGPYTDAEALIHTTSRTGEWQCNISPQVDFAVKLQNLASYDISSPLITNAWFQIVGAYRQGQSLQLWVNGSLWQSNAIPNSPLYVASGSWLNSAIGMYDLPPSPYGGYRGAADDVRFYSRALSDSEVQQLYQYESQPQPCIPHGATATARVDNGYVVQLTLTDGGCGYTNPPLVVIQGGGGTGAAATAVISNGVVVQLALSGVGTGYTNAPKVLIASPPFLPWLSMAVSAVKVTQHVVLGKNYVLESSTDLSTWTPVGPQFTAQQEVITQEFEVDVTGRFFRIRQVP